MPQDASPLAPVCLAPMPASPRSLPAPSTAPRDARFRAIATRDARCDGAFVYAVRTTGVYCRPSCTSRQPRRENVEFFVGPGEAERAGYRACLRCRPGGEAPGRARTARIEALCRTLRASDAAPTLRALAAQVGLSPAYLQKAFKRATGLSPREYHAAARSERARKRLRASARVTDAIYESGFASPSRFYETAGARLGMTPTTFRRGGVHAVLHASIRRSSLGLVLVATSERGVAAIFLGAHRAELTRALAEAFPRARIARADERTVAWVDAALAAVEARPGGDALPFDVRATAFQERVWRALLALAPGTTTTYGALARRLGAPGAARAVGRACGSNVLAVAIPCHRVVAEDGSLGGYRWGLERKRALLAREARQKTK